MSDTIQRELEQIEHRRKMMAAAAKNARPRTAPSGPRRGSSIFAAVDDSECGPYGRPAYLQVQEDGLLDDFPGSSTQQEIEIQQRLQHQHSNQQHNYEYQQQQQMQYHHHQQQQQHQQQQYDIAQQYMMQGEYNQPPPPQSQHQPHSMDMDDDDFIVSASTTRPTTAPCYPQDKKPRLGEAARMEELMNSQDLPGGANHRPLVGGFAAAAYEAARAHHYSSGGTGGTNIPSGRRPPPPSI